MSIWPGSEDFAEGEIRVSILGSGNPWVTNSQAAGSVLVEIGNAERDVLVFDLGVGSLANFSGLRVPVTSLKKVFFSHLHADHIAGYLTLMGSYVKAGRPTFPPEASQRSLRLPKDAIS